MGMHMEKAPTHGRGPAGNLTIQQGAGPTGTPRHAQEALSQTDLVGVWF